MSWNRAAFAGLIYALLMTAWNYWRGAATMPGEWALRFGIYMLGFSVLFWLGMNLLNRLKKRD